MARRRTKKRRKKRVPKWTQAHVRRLFWRAGFGATPEEQQQWAARGRRAAVAWLIEGDGNAELRGPGPSADGKPLDPENEFGHDVLWWLDRMVRTTRPLEERMTLLWHDHFATRDQDPPLMLQQNRMLREHAFGTFDDLLRAITLDPAMQRFLSLAGSHKDAPNENFGRELMELFTIGTGYTEDDIREASRALTGFVEVRRNGRTEGIRFDPKRHDDGVKTILGKTGNFGWEDVLRLCVEHPNHAPYLVETLWDHFIPTPIPPRTKTKLARSYRAGGRRIAPLLARILEHPHMYRDTERATMIKQPVVMVAGTLRRMGAPVDRAAWVYLCASMGQHLFFPPSVAGWDGGTAWMASGTMRARFVAANQLLRTGGPAEVKEGSVDPGLDGAGHLAAARRAVGEPDMSRSTLLVLNRLIAAHLAAPAASAEAEKTRRRHAESLQRTLRHLLVSGPDNQVC